ncbi:putative triacylglycerol lipase [Lupinus albus]|uniref:Putative triacylglycerol lipase n=1 Tax=Lupinus albus TaxID=3870 RepID=A0A6A4Q598_LUPAL|nr:putative triacylglycerol lipase [Lupinus albus]
MILHGFGLRKFLLGGLGPLGCIPNQLSRASAPPGQCVTYVNKIVSMFNDALKTLVDQLNLDYNGSVFVFGNTYGTLADIINNPNTHGFTVTDRACCGCLPMSTPCRNRSEYVFWDTYHPTQAVNNIIIDRALNGPPSDCYPVNVKQMAKM